MYIKLRLKILIIKYLILLLLLNITNIIDITDITKINEVKGEIPSITDFATTQLARDVVTTLGFGCILVATLDNVVTTLSQRFFSDIVTTTKN